MATHNPIPTYFNPEIAPSYKGTSFEEIANSYNNGQQFSNQIQQQQQQGILAQLLAKNTGSNGSVNLDNVLQTVQSNPNQSYQPEMINTLSGLIQQKRAAEMKAQQDSIKFDADTNKTYAETGKIKQEGLGKGLENSEKKFGALNQVWQSAALTGNKSNVLLGLNGAVKAGLIEPDAFDQQRQIIDLMTPEEIKSYASGISFGGAKDPAGILYQTANNAADNTTSSANNVRTTNASIYGTNVGADTADKNRAQQGQQFEQDYALNQQKAYFEQNKPIDFQTGNDGYQYAVYANGKGVRVLGGDGQPIKVQAKGNGAMSATAQKELFETADAVTAGTNAILNLQDALKYSAKAYDGLGAKQRASARGMLGGGSEEATATAMLDNIVTGNALEMLKATFGGAPTEGERAILLQLQGSANMPRTQREAIYTRALQMADARVKSNQGKAESLRNGSFFRSSVQAVPQNTFNLFD
ncbi:hypothetical protein [Acinetobacter silvestris]|uniref:Uncharacterized protein n=1 Tax=Acinetobacter silvestris TaxID=1977882 RepID=A0A1Y3CFG9_9GAMM|nr:hypothetical protein [Acinetobacter silvestris]OTG65839.1 hypothetical protein B9T28_06465 [Acinetobacter silvestris]